MARKTNKSNTTKASQIAAGISLFQQRLTQDVVKIGEGSITLAPINSEVYAYCCDMATSLSSGLRLPNTHWRWVLAFSIVDWSGVVDGAGKEVRPQFTDAFINASKYRRLSDEQLKAFSPAALDVLIERVVNLNTMLAEEKKS